MTGPEHYRAAEHQLKLATKFAQPGNGLNDEQATNTVRAALARGQLHATLALAAATALPSGLFDDWRAVAESPGSGQTGDPS